MKTLMLAATLLAATPAFAQNTLTNTQSPPAGASSESSPQTTNSLPEATGTSRPTQQPGSALGTTTTIPPAAAGQMAPGTPTAR